MPAGMSKRCALLSSISIRLRPSSPGPVRCVERSAAVVARSAGCRGRSASLTDTDARPAVAHVFEPRGAARLALGDLANQAIVRAAPAAPSTDTITS